MSSQLNKNLLLTSANTNYVNSGIELTHLNKECYKMHSLFFKLLYLLDQFHTSYKHYQHPKL